ncbi:MAG: hypothetical protein PSV24_12355 [Rhodoferax sp.]|nr:hypothetical protein [Rhodoferax sp.]
MAWLLWPGRALCALPVLARLPVALIVVGFGLFAPLAQSTSICRWVDESGRTQLSDVVPEQYKKLATCIDSRKYELSPQQQREAESRAAEQKKRALQDAAVPPGGVDASPPVTTGAESLPNAKRPTEAITETTDCASRWRIYDESAACFGPYKTTQGAIKPEGFDHCNDIPSPEITCGPRRN